MPPCLVLTRPCAQAKEFAAQARAQGWTGEVLIAPLMDIRLHALPAAALDGGATLIATSRHAVAALARGTARRDLPLWAVGPGTAQAARKAGFVCVHEAGGDARALMRDMQAAGSQGPFLHLRGAHVAADIVAELRALGHQAQGLIVYSQDARPLQAQARARLQAGGSFVLSAFSPRSAALLVAELPALDPARTTLHAIAISDAAAAPLAQVPLASCTIAQSPDAKGMLAALAATQATLEPWEKPS